MEIVRRVNYYRRIFAAYVARKPSQLTFWHEVLEVNERAQPGELGEYWMTFRTKADYPGPFDAAGVPLLNYHGRIGLQYNPIAIAQYGLGNYNLYRQSGDPSRFKHSLDAADWLVTHLEPNHYGLPVWHHHFDWEYRTVLKAPWYSALAQGQGISLLVRAFRETGEERYIEAARKAFGAFGQGPAEGGVSYWDGSGRVWLEEYVVDPPSHILNGFLWAAWGVYDYVLLTKDEAASKLFVEATTTLATNLYRYDTGYWSLYDLNTTWLPPLASPFYHQLHITQLDVMHRLTGENVFFEYGQRWEGYRRSFLKRNRALACKALFKIFYY
jgi:heparosan-N-sulfate-glucuronate 5-epimerase